MDYCPTRGPISSRATGERVKREAPIHIKLRREDNRGLHRYHEEKPYVGMMREEGDPMSSLTHFTETVKRIFS
jgi:hypothetical protein